jgi:hypothetical protein
MSATCTRTITDTLELKLLDRTLRAEGSSGHPTLRVDITVPSLGMGAMETAGERAHANLTLEEVRELYRFLNGWLSDRTGGLPQEIDHST